MRKKQTDFTFKPPGHRIFFVFGGTKIGKVAAPRQGLANKGGGHFSPVKVLYLLLEIAVVTTELLRSFSSALSENPS